MAVVAARHEPTFAEQLLGLCERGDTVQVGRLLQQRPEEVSAPIDFDQNTALHAAAKSGHLLLTQRLLERNAEVNVVNLGKQSPLHLAAAENHAELALELIHARADLDQADATGQTALSRAAMHGSADVVRVLLDFDADCTGVDDTKSSPMSLAAGQGHTKCLEMILEKEKSNINGENSTGWSALHLAAHGREERETTCRRAEPKFLTAVKMLLAAGANVNAMDEQKMTPLHRAAATGNIDSGKCLIDAKANVNAADNCRWTPLHYACEEGRESFAKLLIESKAVVDFSPPPCVNPLGVAVTENNVAIAALLVKAKADPNNKGFSLASPLMLARKDPKKYADMISLFELGFIHHPA